MRGDETESLQRYYALRAREYESIYAKPERQAELAWLRSHVEDFARGRRVLEVACGTGYWTAVLARSAAAVRATDRTDEVLAIARAKDLPRDVVVFESADAFDLDPVAGRFDAAFAGFWWSHVRRMDLGRFLAGLHRRLVRPARVLLLDNRYVEGSSTSVFRKDAAGDTYQMRALSDGTRHEVLKNFPSPDEVRQVLAAAGASASHVGETTHFWHASYEIANAT